jgi:hypothetical protein
MSITDKKGGKMPITKYIIIPFIFVFLLFIPAAGAQEEPGEVFEWLNTTGGINWTTGTVIAEGFGIPPENMAGQAAASAMACRAAVVVAQRNLLETTKGVRVESETVVENFMLKSDLIRTAISGIVQGAGIRSRKIEADCSCTVTLEIPLRGEIANRIYGEIFLSSKKTPFEVRYGIRLSDITGYFMPAAYAAGEPDQAPWKKDIDRISKRLQKLERQIRIESIRTQAPAEKDPTGIIIDARGINIIPSMSPKIRGWNNEIIYPDEKHKTEAGKIGRLVSIFMNDIILAQNHPRVGSRPLLIKGLRSHGKSYTELVLGKESTDEMVSAMKKGVLENAEVILVTD